MNHNPRVPNDSPSPWQRAEKAPPRRILHTLTHHPLATQIGGSLIAAVIIGTFSLMFTRSSTNNTGTEFSATIPETRLSPELATGSSTPPLAPPSPEISSGVQDALPPPAAPSPLVEQDRIFSKKKISIPADAYADLDIPAGDAEYEVADFNFSWTIGSSYVEPVDGIPLGEAPPTEPTTSAECADYARSQSINGYNIKDLRHKKTAFCLITDQGQVAWLLYIGTTGSPGYRPVLKFELTLWEE